MRYLVTAAVLTAVGTSLLATPAQARDVKMCKLAAKERRHVIKRLDKDAPGRDICKWGKLKHNGDTRRPTNTEKGRYLRNLRNLAHPHPLLTQAGAPRLPPAGTQSARAGGGY